MYSPQARFRFYGSPTTYLIAASDLVAGRITKGNEVRELEAELRKRTETPYALAVAQARLGIYLAVKNLIKPGQKVILSPYTIYDVVNMVICAGGIPVFADIDRATCNLLPDKVEALLDRDTGAVLVTHLHGLAMDLQELAGLCRRTNIPLIEDAAQPFGARSSGQPAGTVGDVGIYSFGLYKNINAFYGGMLITSRKELHKRLSTEMTALPTQKLLPLIRRVGYGLMTEVMTWPPFFRVLPFQVFCYASLHHVESP